MYSTRTHGAPRLKHRRERPFSAAFTTTELARQFRNGIPLTQLSRLADRTSVNTVVTLCMSALITMFVFLDSRQSGVFAWFLAHGGLSLLVYWRSRGRLEKLRFSLLDDRSSRSGLRHAVAWAFVSGALWGSLVLFVPGASPETRLAIILVIGGMAAGASTTLAPVPQVAIVFVWACGMPLVAYFLSLGTALGAMVAVSTIVFGAAMMGTTRVVYQTLARQLDAEERSEYFRAAHLQQRLAEVTHEVRPVGVVFRDCLQQVCQYTGWPAGRAFVIDGNDAQALRPLDPQFAVEDCELERFAGDDDGRDRGVGTELLEKVRSTGQAAWERRQLPPADETSREFESHHVIGVPIVSGGKVVAVFEFFAGDSARPSTHLIELLSAIGIQVGSAVERHKALRQLEDSENRVRREESRAREYLDIAGAIIIAIDRDGLLTLMNSAGARLLGCTERSAIGMNWFDHFVPEDGRERRKSEFKRWMNGERPLVPEYEVTMQCTNGEIVLVQGTMALLKDESGGICGLLGSGQDITQQRRVEAQLLQVQKMEAVGQLAAGIAHDFNNILTAAGGNLELLEQCHDLDKDAGLLVSNSRLALDSAAALTNQLLSFSRRSLLSPRPVDVGAVVKSMMKIVARTLRADIVVDIEESPGLWCATADRTQLETSILNLAINARDAMPDGGHLRIALTNMTVDSATAADFGVVIGEYVAIAIADTGIGMPPDIQARMFEPFFTTKKAASGSGLGLSMVYGFATQSAGGVAVHSRPGSGTEVVVILPRSPKQHGEISNGSAIRAARSKDATYRILVVDDEEAICNVTAQMLRQQGYIVTCAASAERAMGILHDDGEFDLLLTDIQLGPGMDGYALAQQLMEHWPATRVAFMSGYADVGPEDNGWPNSTLLKKPFDLERLASAVAEALALPP